MRPAINRDSSVDTIDNKRAPKDHILNKNGMKPSDARKGSIDPIMNRGNDIFGNS